MKKLLADIIPVVRMAVSGEVLKTVCFCPNSEIEHGKFESVGNFKSITVTRESIEDLLIPANLKKIRNLDIIYVENEGSLLIATSPALIENLKLNVSTGKFASSSVITGRFQNKIFVIAGSAKVFSAELAEEIFHEGANILIADLNEEAGLQLVNQLNNRGQANKAEFFKTDLSNAKSVQQMVEHTVSHFGGIDVLIGNSGFLPAENHEELNKKDSGELISENDINFTNCIKYISCIMGLQTQNKQGYYCDIIYINSLPEYLKSIRPTSTTNGCKGNVFSKSLALDLIKDKIKLNSICPRNFFEDPLWSHPENGLFVQTLKTEKVPSAKTVKDVRTYFESQIPAGRGCKVKDVVKAIFYLIEQEYETGQTMHVSGGQSLLQ